MARSLLPVGLLVIVLVTGLLISMTRPVLVSPDLAPRGGLFGPLASSRGKAMQASCMANVKQLALASLMYCQDYDQRFAPDSRWTDCLYPYTKNTQIFVCPAAPQLTVGYAYNKALSFRPLGKIARPAQTLMFADSDRGGNNPSDLLAFPTLPPRHNGGANVGFADGHVKWYAVPPPPPPPTP